MKFVCDNCATQYLISDEKVGPKGAKVRCKRCGNIIVLRPPRDVDDREEKAGPTQDTSRDGLPLGGEERDELGEAFDQLLKGGAETGDDEDEDEEEEEGQATEIFSMEELERLRGEKEDQDKIDEVFSQAESTDIRPSQTAAKGEDREEWYVAVNDEQVGPMGLPEVENRWESDEIRPSTLAWHPGMDDWVAIQEIPKLRYLLGSMESREVPESVEAGAAPSAPAEEEWAPSAGSSLASLVETEMEAVRDSEPPSKEAAGMEAEEPAGPVEGGLDPWEGEEVASGEVARPKESFFDSTLDQPVADSGEHMARSARGMSRPAYLSERSKGRLNKKLILIGSISLVVLIVVGVVVFKLVQEPPEEEPGKMAPIEKPAGADQKGKSPEKGAKPEKKESAAKKEEEKPEEKLESNGEGSGDEKKKEDEMVVGKARRKPGLRTPSSPKGKKGTTKTGKKRKKVAKGSSKPVVRTPPKEKQPEPPPSGAGVSKTLSKAQIASTMKKYIRAMKGCVKQQQQRDPSVTGTMLVSFVINGNGKVSLIQILSTEHKGTYVAGCITYIIKSMKFPKFSGTPITIPRVPLRLGG